MAPVKWMTIALAIEETLNDLPLDELLPSEAALCELFDVSRGTVRRAYRYLQDRQLVRVVQGVGYFPMAPRLLCPHCGRALS